MLFFCIKNLNLRRTFVKFIVSVLILVLFLLFNVNNSNAQEKNLELEKLEAQLNQLDKETGSVQVKFKGDNETSGTINITVERQVPVTNKNGNKSITGIAKTRRTEV